LADGEDELQGGEIAASACTGGEEKQTAEV